MMGSLFRLSTTQSIERLARFGNRCCFSRLASTLIEGGGPMGSSVAFHLAQAMNEVKSDTDIIAVERDPTYQSYSAMKSAGGIRQQFSLTENVQMSLYSRDFLRQSADGSVWIWLMQAYSMISFGRLSLNASSPLVTSRFWPVGLFRTLLTAPLYMLSFCAALVAMVS